MRNRVLRRKTIKFGDKIFARVTQNGKTLENIVTDTVSSFTDIIMRVRKLLKGVKGLVMVHIRNYNQGWGEDRPLMLYPEPESIYVTYQEKSIGDVNINADSRQMLFPWETH